MQAIKNASNQKRINQRAKLERRTAGAGMKTSRTLLPSDATKHSMWRLRDLGYSPREIWLGNYFDGMAATKRVGAHRVEIYTGAENGEPWDSHYLPQLYVDDRFVGEARSVEQAARMAEFRIRMLGRAAIANATGELT